MCCRLEAIKYRVQSFIRYGRLVQDSVTHYEVIIIGGGAAGLMCAATAAQRGRRVLVLEKANKVGKKILMSGGGRCNFTNYSVDAEITLPIIHTFVSRH